MKFKEINNYKYIKYVVKTESSIMPDQKVIRKEKTFEQIQKAIDYIKYLKDEIKKHPFLYPNPNTKIIMEKIVTKSNVYEVLEGE